MSSKNRSVSKSGKSLEQREYEIESGANQMREALCDIYDNKLWDDAGYKSFESYCLERWGWKKAFAYYQLDAHRVASRLSTKVDLSEIPTKERHLREVAKAPEEKQAAVVQAANEKAWAEDREPTAKDFKEAVEQIRQQTLLDADGEELTGDAELIEYEDDDEEIAADEPEWWLNRTQANRLKKTLTAFKKELNAIVEAPGLELLVQNRKRIVMDLGNIQTVLNGAMPYDRCPYCNGLANDCRGCSDRGWVVRSVFNSAPKELRDGVARLSAGGDS